MEECLVTVGVATYNSSKFVVETLDSIFSQTYKRIELIVSDDGSTDDTVMIVNNWIKKHASRFERVQVLTVVQNTGTAANGNRQIKAARGKWVKFIAGDDVLFSDCIDKLMSYIRDNQSVDWLFGKSVFYNGKIDDDCINEDGFTRYNTRLLKMLNGTAEDQFKSLLKFNNFVGPGHFFRRETLISVGGFDEELFILEDHPMWLRLTGAGVKCYFLNDFIVGYRLSDQSVCANTTRLFNPIISKLSYLMRKKYCYPYYRKRDKFASYLKYRIDRCFQKFGCNKNSYDKLYSSLHRVVNQLYK